MTISTHIGGHVAPDFERCREAFETGFRSGSEVGAACAIRVGGETVVDIWGGAADGITGRAWERDTIVPVFSVSKGVAAVCVLHLVSQGLLDLDEPVSTYWPEFAVSGKSRVTVRQALAHRAGVPFVDGEVTIQDLQNVPGMAARLAAQKPIFDPGATHIYHPVSIGWITSELVRRVTGNCLGDWLRTEICEPLGLSIFMGLPAQEGERVARLVYRDPETAAKVVAETMMEDTLPWHALTLNGLLSFAPDLGKGSLNDPAVQRLELAGAGGIADARSLATFYGACIAPVDGVRLMSDEVIADSIKPVSTGRQFGLEEDGPSWAAGVMTPWRVQPMLGGSSFGHDGMGGSLAFAEPRRQVAFAYVRNGMAAGGFEDPEVYAVVAALQSILEETE
ncbi:serine hydrolase domain-containing protein [Sphingomonas sp. TX0543]|uniref:serine hydrolase domain-containing protein n=1 Tax=unclassified Sphingomonas TaxID=196159 RepID=UPI0010F93B96|nr:serine hydrolase domain-containing protein [Sphingomonas sp. 3P27F8]